MPKSVPSPSFIGVRPKSNFAVSVYVASFSSAAKLLRNNPYQINIAQHNKTMMERGEVKAAAMKQAVEHLLEHMPR